MKACRWLWVLVLVVLVQGRAWANPEAIRGAWLSPDWLFPGPGQYTEADVRRIVHDTFIQVKKQGINTVFFETMLRGTTICAPVSMDADGTVHVSDDPSLYPVYRPLAFPFRIENNAPVDTLQILIDEGRQQGIQVHAWCHMFYWRMDNSDLVPAWKEGHSAWDDLLLAYLHREHALLGSRLGVNYPLVRAIEETQSQVRAGYTGGDVEKVLDQEGIPQHHNPLGSLLAAIMAAGGDAPDFLLITTPEDPFPAPQHKLLRAIFVDPANPQIEDRIIAQVTRIVVSHPGLSGVQLDHIRYPTGPVGTPPELGLIGMGTRDFDYFDANNPILNDRYQKTVALLAHRREVLEQFVNRLRRSIGGGVELSCAILPEYHRERNDGRYRISYWDFISQEWYHWDIDFVVPLMYELPSWKIRTLMIRYREDLEALYGDEIPIRIYPGVSRLQQAESGLLQQEDWVFFDLKLAGDTHVGKEQQVDPVVEDAPSPAPAPSPEPSPAPAPGTVQLQPPPEQK